VVGALEYRDPSCYTWYYELHIVDGSSTLLAVVVDRCDTYDVIHVYKMTRRGVRKVFEEFRPHQPVGAHLRFLEGRLRSLARK
jgi:hypothetical protein